MSTLKTSASCEGWQHIRIPTGMKSVTGSCDPPIFLSMTYCHPPANGVLLNAGFHKSQFTSEPGALSYPDSVDRRARYNFLFPANQIW